MASAGSGVLGRGHVCLARMPWFFQKEESRATFDTVNPPVGGCGGASGHFQAPEVKQGWIKFDGLMFEVLLCIFFLMLDFSCFKSRLSVLKLVFLKFKLNPHVAHILVVCAETGGTSRHACIAASGD